MVVSGIKGQPKVILHQAGKRVYNQVLEGISTGWCFGLNPVFCLWKRFADRYFSNFYTLTVAQAIMNDG